MLLNVKEPRFISFGDVRLGPGADNRVSKKQYEEMKKNSMFAQLLEDGVIEEVDGSSQEDAELESHADQLSKLSPAKANQLVADCMDKELLAQWEANETRPSVKKAIAAQKAKLDEEMTARSEQPEGADVEESKGPAVTAHLNKGGKTVGQNAKGDTSRTLGGEKAEK